MVNFYSLNFVILAIGSFTLLVLFLICFYFIYNKNNRNDRNELIFELSITNIISVVSYMVYFHNYKLEEPSPGCEITGFLILSSELSSCIWGAIIGYYTKRTVIIMEAGKSRFSQKLRIINIIIGYLFPVTLGLFGVGFQAYNSLGDWCWLSADLEDSRNAYKSIIISFITYAIEFVAIAINLVLSILLISYFYKDKKLNRDELSELKGVVWNTIKYPIIQFCCLIPSSIILLIFLFKLKPGATLQSNYTNISRLLMCLQATIVSICYAINIGAFNIFKCKRKTSPSKSDIYNSGGDLFGKSSSLLTDENKTKEDYSLKDIGNCYSS